VNYAGIGHIISHEIAHAFDPKGRQIDSHGAIRDWWGANATQLYQDQGQCFIDHFNQYYIISEEGEKIHVQGEQTLDENIADYLGIRQSWSTWKATSKTNPSLPSFKEYTEEQLFFMAFGLGYCEIASKGYMKQSIEGDGHSPAFARVNGIAQNSREFAKAFQCPVGSPMNPVKKCSVW
jgi:predicted metalloendopeptidase